MLGPVYLKAQRGLSVADFYNREEEAQAIAQAAHGDDANVGGHRIEGKMGLEDGMG